MSKESKRLWMTPKAGQCGMTARTKGRPLELSTHLQAQVHCAEQEQVEMSESSAQLPLLQGDSLANLSVLQGSEKARKMTATSGQKCLPLSEPSDPLGCLLRMLLESSRWHSTLCYLTWRTRATPQRRWIYQLVPSMPNTDGIESGLWATPQAMDCLTPKQEKGLTKEITESRKGRSKFADLKEQAVYGVKMWPSPRAGNLGSRPNQKGGKILAEEVKKLLPTPKERDWKGQTQRGIYAEQDALPNMNRGDGKVIGGQLNPNWVEWLTGFPIGWTDLDV